MQLIVLIRFVDEASPLRKLDLNLLVSLEALVAERSVTRAAKRLGLSQPAMSAQLARLRALFDDPLLVSGPRGMVPTEKALELQPRLSEQLAGLEALLAAERFDPASARATFRIAASDAIHAVFGNRLVARLRQVAPGVRVALQQLNGESIGRQMEVGDVDVVMAAQKSLQETWMSRRLYEETFVCVVRQDHPVLGGPLTLEAYCALDHLLVSTSGGHFTGIVDDRLAEIGRERRVVVSVQDFMLVPQLVAGTDLIATIPRRVALEYGPALVVLDTPLPLPGFSIRLAWHPRTQRDPARRWLRREMAALAGALSGEPVGAGDEDDEPPPTSTDPGTRNEAAAVR